MMIIVKVAELSHSMLSPMSFRVEYKRATTGPVMFQRHVRFQVDITTISKQNEPVCEFLYAITFTLLSGNIRRFRRVCEHIQTQVCTRRLPPPSPKAQRKMSNDSSASSSCSSDTSERLSSYNTRQVSAMVTTVKKFQFFEPEKSRSPNARTMILVSKVFLLHSFQNY